MAPLNAAARPRGRPGRPPRKHSRLLLKGPRGSDAEAGEGPPPKRRKYVPGGPGGGGRYIEIDEEEPVVKSPAPVRNISATRSRSAPENGTQPVESPAPPPPPPAALPPATPPSVRPRRDKSQTRGRYPSSTAAALALQQGDGYKPREERGWEEFHPDLDIEAKFAVFTAEEVDGANGSAKTLAGGLPNGALTSGLPGSPMPGLGPVSPQVLSPTPIKRRPGRPPRRPDALIYNLLTPDQPKVVPPPGPNPREKLTLPKPSFQLRDPFVPYEQKGLGQRNYVDRTMASVGYQESDMFVRHERRLIRMSDGLQDDDVDLTHAAPSDGDVNAAVGRVEYDMDEQDEQWLEDYNAKRREDQLEPIKPAIFEITMTKIEKEWHVLEKRIPKPNPKPPQTQRPRSSSAAAVNGEITGPGEEQDSKCAICDDGDCENSNAIVFCDGCDLAVHQECYGVPFIPEGQWLCRKCQLIGRGNINCIFCPNTEGAFKQTTTSKWSHLLCAIWIPEVSLGNPSLMEPVTDVEKVPRSRWKLQCYICRQRMGASIQCSNKNCFVAFHVTCARRAQLYLKMKPGHGSSAVMDSHLLKAFCDKHVPPEWRREHGTDAATADAIEYYRNTMQGRRWGDSQAAALSLEPSHPMDGEHTHDDEGGPRTHTPRITLTVGGSKRKRLNIPRTIWKLPSGAPVIPHVVLNSVVASLQRFSVRQRKQYAEDACKYWTLKREARRGAALLKRLQLQLETFSSMEMTRRDYTAMGATGGKRLQRRIEFGERLYRDLDRLRMLCDEVKKREREKLKDAEMLRNIVDLVYFPLPPLLWPIFEKAQGLDGKGFFRGGFASIRTKLQERNYTSVAAFSADLAAVFTSEIGVQPAGDTAELQMQISGRDPELNSEQREKRKMAKRIIKAIQPALEDAIRSESELNRRPFEKELKELDVILENSVLSRRGSLVESADVAENTEPQDLAAPSTLSDNVADLLAKSEPTPGPEMPTHIATPAAAEEEKEKEADHLATAEEPSASAPTDETLISAAETKFTDHLTTAVMSTSDSGVAINGELKPDHDTTNPQPPVQLPAAQKAPPTPPLSFQGDQQAPLAQGGIQWYMQPFDPVGTTIHEERWTGRDVMRGMSEELSELDEEELEDLVGDHKPPAGTATANATGDEPSPAEPPVAADPEVKVHRTRRRWRGFK
ncbi:hypothetical protein ASPZODRAFT_134303 [Penicilliopsis zonata CBS 506.65]|uniref:PHD-type domain-containing protein n=1 Tax=Penicilliopsis zonata CBS 506.65 TaxID=1073090 RepID=A0A1L9SCL3_9EURO|nr:hypothetical protein ASPZODRAFT_134303 [Penicilliopsis zonata CBS 506.65]OJJ44894.1 hypothetical protein ASPZODRAFT_134303 [Penicilliopsis zonata CBS 506.65]